MKVNCISYDSVSHIQTDMESIHFMFKKCKDKLDIKSVNGHQFKCEPASINIFINMINPCLLKYAKVNLVLVDPSEFQTNMIYTLKDVDGILVKTKYAYDIISSECIRQGIFLKNEVQEKIHMIQWRSPDLSTRIVKNKDRVLLFCQNANTPVYMNIVKLWKQEYPQLFIVNGNANRFCAIRDKGVEYPRVVFLDTIKNDQFHKLFNESAYHICVDESSAFDHMTNQAKLVGSIPIGCKSGGRAELMNKDFSFILGGKRKKKIAHKLGASFITKLDTLTEVMDEIVNTSDSSIESMMRSATIDALRYQKESEDLFLNVFKKYILQARSSKKTIRDKLTMDELPSISIITPTYNRKKIFPLAIYNYNTLNYPREKLEWIVIDDSEKRQSIEDQLPPENMRDKYKIKYVHLEEKKTLAEKRHMGVLMASNDFVLLMDDDDYFYPDMLTNRMNEFLNIKRDYDYKKVMGFTILGCFDIERYVSWINVTNGDDPLSSRVAASSLLFERSFYNDNRKFNIETEGDGLDTFLNNNESAFVEQSWENNFVSISHKNCIQGKHTPEKQDANGCHFGFSKKLFEFMVELFKEPDNEVKTQANTTADNTIENKSREIITPTDKIENTDAIDYEIVDTPEPEPVDEINV